MRGVDILLDQHAAWLWFVDTLIKGLLYSEYFHFEVDDCACAIASLLDLEIIEILFWENIGVSMPIISDSCVDIFWTCIEYGCGLYTDLCHEVPP